ncbi:hypothetical protein [uncultured Devosia sp.]|uniref:hypothetical protein n=1 Tax=uncultured Devosia sp. TaxID=211434 RepID=UPI00261BD656|nr:hypothetical protein [uncultured Devosia sp.]
MISIPALVALLVPVPALRNAATEALVQRRRRRAVAALHLEPHLLKDVGLEAYESPADDPRWVRRFDLDR